MHNIVQNLNLLHLEKAKVGLLFRSLFSRKKIEMSVWSPKDTYACYKIETTPIRDLCIFNLEIKSLVTHVMVCLIIQVYQRLFTV
jgi:hypothetical protein